jgi:hypothetical protein
LKGDKEIGTCGDASRYMFVKTSYGKNEYLINDVERDKLKANLSENMPNVSHGGLLQVLVYGPHIRCFLIQLLVVLQTCGGDGNARNISIL